LSKKKNIKNEPDYLGRWHFKEKRMKKRTQNIFFDGNVMDSPAVCYKNYIAKD